ncbi:MAG: hypothetical protein MUF00_09125 [Gemmatimonadaceae bacterium]|nr:hypothetical protein [Gemmatimonadaceae bacterium]
MIPVAAVRRGFRNAGLLPAPIRLRARRAERAIRHLLRVVAGLESPLRGETEIQGQWRSAWRAARDARQTGRELDWWAMRLLDGARRIRQRVLAVEPFAYADLWRHVVRTAAPSLPVPWDQATVTIIGTGHAAERLVRDSRHAIPGRMLVVGRQLERAARLAVSPSVDARAWHTLEPSLIEADVAVFAIRSPVPVIDASLIDRVTRDGRARVWVDLGVPPVVNAAGALRATMLHPWSVEAVDATSRECRLVERLALQDALARVADDWHRRTHRHLIGALREAALGAASDAAECERVPGVPHDALDRTARQIAQRMLHAAIRMVGDGPAAWRGLPADPHTPIAE